MVWRWGKRWTPKRPASIRACRSDMSLTKVTDQSVNISAAVDEFMIKFFVALLVVMAVCLSAWGGAWAWWSRRRCL